MSKGASLAPQEIRIDFAVFPETKCQGLFNQFVGLHNEVFVDIQKPYQWLALVWLIKSKQNDISYRFEEKQQKIIISKYYIDIS